MRAAILPTHSFNGAVPYHHPRSFHSDVSGKAESLPVRVVMPLAANAVMTSSIFLISGLKPLVSTLEPESRR
jgi:hypothetical protein